ncbi:hypothetical protein [Microvirga sp. M2]|uniref:hypothetical protein n=1 Tax=Microvirga sp. M2 TaxID=3073270 RepID=UPI0039C08D91
MRKLLFGLLGCATLGVAGLAAPQAEAQPYYGYGYRQGPVVVRQEYRRPHYRGHGYGYRPTQVVRRCWVEPRRVWNGYRWVRRPIEVCRTARGPGYRW